MKLAELYSCALSKLKKKNNGSEQHRSVNDTVQIDGQGYGIVTEVIFRGFATLYLIRILDSSFEVWSTKCMQEGDQ